MATKDDDFVPVTGGVALPGSSIRPGLENLANLKAASDLDRHILQFLALHPEVPDRFRSEDLAQLSDEAKQDLLQNLNDLLGIRPVLPAKR